MNLLNKVNLSQVLFFDIETATESENLPDSKIKIAKNKWKKDEYDELNKEYQESGALYPEFAKIICVVLAYYKDGDIVYKSIEGEETNIINEFYRIVNDYILCGFNISKFDLPFIRLRAMVHGIQIPENLNDMGLRPWDVGLSPNSKIRLLDLLDLIKGLFPFYFSLESVCGMLGLGSPKEEIKGAEVSKAYHDGRISEIIEYCKRDVKATIEVLLRLRGQELVNKPIIQSIIETKTITLEQLEAIKPFYNSLQDDEKIKVQEIILACLINKGEGDFFIGKDDAATISYKEELVKNLDK